MMGFAAAVSLKHSGRVRVAAGAVAQRPTAIVALWINAGLAERAASSIEMPRSGEHDGSHDGVEDRVDSGGEEDNNGLENDCAAVLREEDITETFIRGWGTLDGSCSCHLPPFIPSFLFIDYVDALAVARLLLAG